MAGSTNMLKALADLHEMAGLLYDITKRGGRLYRKTKEQPTTTAAYQMQEAARHMAAAKRSLRSATNAPSFAWLHDAMRIATDPLPMTDGKFASTSENAPLQKLKEGEQDAPQKHSINNV